MADAKGPNAASSMTDWVPSIPAKPHGTVTYKDAFHWAKGFAPQEGVQYHAAAEYAQQRYEELSATWDRLDEKADTIAKYCSSGIGVLTAGAALIAHAGTPLPQSPLVAGLAIGAVLFFLAATAAVIITRAPSDTFVPAHAQQVIATAEILGSSGEQGTLGVIAAAYYCAAVGVKESIARKARTIGLASTYAVLGLLTLAGGACALLGFALGA